MTLVLSIFKWAHWTFVACGLSYILILLALTEPFLQRHAFYMHKINPLIWPHPFRTDLDDFEQYGFLNKQVTPFTLQTYDGVDLAAYHILPLDVYHKHEDSLLFQDESQSEAYTGSNVSSAYPVSLLLNNPKAKVIVNFHGNAGHAFFLHRPLLYRSLLSHSTPDEPVHLITFDYRGFGLSQGSPTEEGLITDGLTLLNLLTSAPFSIPPENIVLIGQSLGTAVSTATAHAWALNTTHPANPTSEASPLTSLNLILMSSFTNVPDLLETYRIQGLIPPIFSPLQSYPALRRFFTATIVDTWNTSSRIESLVSRSWAPQASLQLSIMHAKDDWDIPWAEGMRNWESALRGALPSVTPNVTVTSNGDNNFPTLPVPINKRGRETAHIIQEYQYNSPSSSNSTSFSNHKPALPLLIRFERALHGAHNDVGLHEWTRLAVKRVLDHMSATANPPPPPPSSSSSSSMIHTTNQSSIEARPAVTLKKALFSYVPSYVPKYLRR